MKTFLLSYASGEAVPFIPGQFITLVFSSHGNEERRSFSISSAENEQLAITVKRVDNGAYSRMLADRARPGDILYTSGVAGLFILPVQVKEPTQIFFFAAGIGITPVFSLVKSALETRPAAKVVLIYSNRSAAEVIFHAELERLQQRYQERLVIEYLFSTSFNLARARLNKALVRTLLKEYSDAATTQLFYVCGPHDYMRMVIYGLEESGVSDAQIRRENFNMNSRVVTHSIPPDTNAHTITFLHNGQRQAVVARYPETILKAAKRNGISLPYSCEVGRCGSCAQRCISGKVWHSYNEVLMDTDLRAGAILTCTGYAIGGDVIIEI